MDIFTPILLLTPGHAEEEARIETLDPVDNDSGISFGSGCIIA